MAYCEGSPIEILIFSKKLLLETSIGNYCHESSCLKI